ncbi:MAG: HU family DNA-binding protein [Alphaproteobacteria bacterium]|nr:HU family DNA-binding protein [Alphaproteobacteria bacterium]MCY4320550.1 HU family DNA-binding protein [Alphaproteobacteria bacterium]
MNKNDLVGAVAVSANLQRTQAGQAVEAVFDTISKALADGQDVRLIGFGTFSVAHRPAARMRNPRTGEAIDVAPSNQPKFKAGKGLKDAVN